MRLKLEITPRALGHLDEIQIRLDDARSGRANKFIAKLEKVGEYLTAFPELGTRRESIGKDLRGFKLWDYVLLYRVGNTQIYVEAIIHSSRDVKAAFQEKTNI